MDATMTPPMILPMNTPSTPSTLQNAIRMILYMGSIPDEQFDITHWVTRLHGRIIRASNRKCDCGTVCCFVGHLPLAFPDDFHYREHEGDIDIQQCERPADLFIPPLRPIADFFGITYEDLTDTVFANGYEEREAVTKDVVVGRFMDKVQRAHGVDLESLLKEARKAHRDPIAESQEQHKDIIQH